MLMSKHKSLLWLLSLICLRCHLYLTQYMKRISNSSPTSCAIYGQRNLFQSLSCLPRWQSSWGQNGANLGPIGPRWAPCWLHEPCYLGILFQELQKMHLHFLHTRMWQKFEINPRIIQQSVCPTLVGPWSPINWRRNEPGHQQWDIKLVLCEYFTQHNKLIQSCSQIFHRRWFV